VRLKDIPGYVRARQAAARRGDRLQDYWRDYSFLGLDEEIRVANGEGDPVPSRALRTVKVRQLTLQMFIELCAVRSPFLCGGRIQPEHVQQILWRVSPQYDLRVTDPEAGVRFRAATAQLPYRPSIRAVVRYLDRMLIDKPPSRDNGGGRSDTSFAASVVHALANCYGWTDQVILRLPMPALFQYLKKIGRDYEENPAVFNPLRDRFTQRVFKFYKAKRAELLAAAGS
jgi:hypothetical protein